MNNVSRTLTRKATELDVGSRVVYEGEIREVVAVGDVVWSDRRAVSILFADGTSTLEALSAMFTCVCRA